MHSSVVSSSVKSSSVHPLEPVLRAEPLTERIRNSLAALLRVPASRVTVPENAEKYYDEAAPRTAGTSLEEVFHLMRSLNERGMADARLGCAEGDGHSLRSALKHVVDDLCQGLEGEPIQYTELGPEPVKTGLVLRRLRERGVDVRRYNGVDINPASRATMERELAPVLAAGRFTYHHTLFEELGRLDYRLPGTRNLVTMLGFEEGNEHPAAVSAMLDEILRPGDLFLSEMQVLSEAGWQHVFNFYQCDLMRRFSQLALERSRPGVRKSQYGVYLTPLALSGDGAPTMAAVTAQVIPGNGTRVNEVFVTNYCLKFAAEEYRKLREASGRMKVVAERATGDGSVVFQLSRRL